MRRKDLNIILRVRAPVINSGGCGVNLSSIGVSGDIPLFGTEPLSIFVRAGIAWEFIGRADRLFRPEDCARYDAVVSLGAGVSPATFAEGPGRLRHVALRLVPGIAHAGAAGEIAPVGGFDIDFGKLGYRTTQLHTILQLRNRKPAARGKSQP